MSADARHTAEAHVATAQASRYLQQLCKHFAHKLPETTFDTATGRIPFSLGPCDLDATTQADTLILRVAAGNADDLASLQDVVARHLERFAFREPVTVTWTPAV